MKRLVPLAISALAVALPFSPAGASGDYGCDPRWKLTSNSLDPCGNRGMLSPGNDTRVNMFYLLLDRQQVPSTGLAYPKLDYEDRSLGRNFFNWTLLRKAYDPGYERGVGAGEFAGSRCVSLASGAQAFGAAMAANRKLPTAERDKLVQARGQLVARCQSQQAGVTLPTGIASAPGKDFLGYLTAADAFYAGEWDTARSGFGQLRRSRDPWLAETAVYMLARSDLNFAQAGSFDQYGDFAGVEKTDKAALASARAGFDAYLKTYPKGRYAASARGLIRRTLWLAGDVPGLAREYEAMLGAVPLTGRGAGDLVEEVDNKLITARGKRAVDGPMLLATIDLMMMRGGGDGDLPVITAAQLAAQEPRFAGRADLFGFVTANHAFYVEKDMRKVLRLIPDDARQSDYSPLAFSRQMLRGMALAALRDRNEAGFWRELLGGATGLYQRPLVELALALNYERSGKLADVFAAGSPIGDTVIREILLHNVAGPDLLRAQAKNTARPQHERDLALFTLLTKQLNRGDYAGFLGDSKLVRADGDTQGGLWDVRTQEQIPLSLFRAGKWSDGYACPALATTAATLARNAADTRARLCLGDFYRINGFDYLEANTIAPKADELGGSAPLFPGKAVYRGTIYADVIADPRAPAGDKAYALFRAINCYAPSGNNECGGVDAPEGQRKAWFQRLKRDYPASEWSRQLRYYW